MKTTKRTFPGDAEILNWYFKIDEEAEAFYAAYRFDDGSALFMAHQERYTINASMIKALAALRQDRESVRRTLGGSLSGIPETIRTDAISFNKTLKAKYGVEHTLPQSLRNLNKVLIAFEREGYACLVSAKNNNANARKVTNALEPAKKRQFKIEAVFHSLRYRHHLRQNGGWLQRPHVSAAPQAGQVPLNGINENLGKEEKP